MYTCVGICPSKHGASTQPQLNELSHAHFFFLEILSKHPSGWLGSGMRRKKGDNCEKNNDYDAVWWSERSMKVCGAHYIVLVRNPCVHGLN